MTRHITPFIALGLIGFSVMAQDAPQDGTPMDVEPLMRGPIHEAYAEPVALTDEDPFIIPAEPPARVEEIPPADRPEGDGVTWIPGYWNWDDERQDFIWVSGVWRKGPVGRTWLPGEWAKVDAGYRWVPGRWGADGRIDDNPLPVPPLSLEQGPTSEAVSDNVFWVPGSWQYQERRYVWRPGFWSPSHADWVWIPDHYVSVPKGCHFVSGYWDYGWDNRGTLYAPCYIDRHIAYRRGYYYRPSVVVDVSGAFFHLWVRPTYRHYYFGDYYDDHYASYGFRPWHSFYAGYRHGYDPLFSYYHWRFRRDHVNLQGHLRGRHRHHVKHSPSRPAHRRFSERNVGGRVQPLTNAQRGALIHRPADRKAAAVAANQRGAIRAQLLQQHRDRLRDGGSPLAGASRQPTGSSRPVATAHKRSQSRRGSGGVARQRLERSSNGVSEFVARRPNDAANNIRTGSTGNRRASVTDSRQAAHASRSRASAPGVGRRRSTGQPSAAHVEGLGRDEGVSRSRSRRTSHVEAFQPRRKSNAVSGQRSTTADRLSASRRDPPRPRESNRANFRSDARRREVNSGRPAAQTTRDRSGANRSEFPESSARSASRSNGRASAQRALPRSGRRAESRPARPRPKTTPNRVLEPSRSRSRPIARPSRSSGSSVRNLPNRGTSARPASRGTVRRSSARPTRSSPSRPSGRGPGRRN